MQRKDFDRDFAPQPRIARAIDFSHPARTNERNDFIRAETNAGRKRQEWLVVAGLYGGKQHRQKRAVLVRDGPRVMWRVRARWSVIPGGRLPSTILSSTTTASGSIAWAAAHQAMALGGPCLRGWLFGIRLKEIRHVGTVKVEFGH